MQCQSQESGVRVGSQGSAIRVVSDRSLAGRLVAPSRARLPSFIIAACQTDFIAHLIAHFVVRASESAAAGRARRSSRPIAFRSS